MSKSDPQSPILAGSRIVAGFPSPADDFIDKKLDLNEYLVHHPSATFFVRVEGDSMIGAGIHSGDLLIVDRSLEAMNNYIIVAVVNGELTVKRLRKSRNKICLVPENDHYPVLDVTPDMDFAVWGIVTHVIHKLI
ncbi:MAG: translesion error-prone DNA polymerase V autoproteolytic subunit [Candidatus Delongbacteria bacterium]|nr:translesion error-prone DNA polymerase V autoproteolytic subunit [Candidatus Delongbacteria bacterium]